MKEKELYSGPIFKLITKDVMIKDKAYRRDIIRHAGGVGILVIQDHKILLVRQMRHAIDQTTLEIPAGKLEYGEDPKSAGLRELNEETGLDCKELKLVQSIVSTPGFCDERIWIYEAIDCFQAEHKLSMDEDEEIETIWMPLKEAYQKLCANAIQDAKTVVAILHACMKEGIR